MSCNHKGVVNPCWVCQSEAMSAPIMLKPELVVPLCENCIDAIYSDEQPAGGGKVTAWGGAR